MLRPSLHHKKRRGFTLIELLIAITVLGLLTSLCAGLLHVGQRSWITTNRMALDISSVEEAQTFLRNELTRTQPLLIQKNGKPVMAFTGTQEALSFYAPLPRAFDSYGIVEMRILIEDATSGGKEVVVEWRPPSADSWNRSVVLAGIQNAGFRYYGDGGAGRRSWQATWLEQKTLPQSIELDIEFSADDSRHWPIFVVSPMITVGANQFRTFMQSFL